MMNKQQKPTLPLFSFQHDNTSLDPEIFDDDDDGTIPASLETAENSSLNFLVERISLLKVETSSNLAQQKYAGLHPKYNLGAKNPNDKLRGSMLIETLRVLEYCLAHRIFITYRQLFYFIQGLLPKFSEYVKLLWLQVRPNVRLIEKILYVPRDSSPILGTPKGYLALGVMVELTIEGKKIGPVAKEFKIPFGENSVLDMGSFETNAKLIVYIESHAELQNLIQDGILKEAQHTIFVSSSGNPDLGFCLMLSKIVRETGLSVRFLVDSDINGFIMAGTVAFGRFCTQFRDGESLLTPYIQPLGILPSEFLPSDLLTTEMTELEMKGILTLENKWQAHGIELVRDQKFWLDVVQGFKDNGRSMTLAQMRLNRGPRFLLNRIVQAQKSVDPLEIRKNIEKTETRVFLSRENENDPYFN